MNRPSFGKARLVVAVLVGLPVLACSGSGEQQILQKYFSAMRLRDQTTLTNIATVSYDSAARGTVQSFSVTNVAEETRKPLQLRTFRKAFEDARASDEEFSKKMKAYQDENLEAIDRVLQIERKNGKPSGRDAQVQAEWAKYRQEMSVHAKSVDSARGALSDERGLAEVSAYSPSTPIDVTEYDGELISKDVTIAADVRMADGSAVDKNLIVTMQRVQLKKEGSPDINGRWIITDIKDPGAPSTN